MFKEMRAAPATRDMASLARSRISAAVLGPALAVALCVAWPGSARADLRMCNLTESRVGVSLGYRDGTGWVTEGWWNISPRGCDILLKGDLSARFYYIYAIDYDRGGDWSGRSFMCTREREFTIRGVEDCLARGFDRTGFFEIDSGEQKSWTVQLTDPGRADSGALGSGQAPSRQ